MSLRGWRIIAFSGPRATRWWSDLGHYFPTRATTAKSITSACGWVVIRKNEPPIPEIWSAAAHAGIVPLCELCKSWIRMNSAVAQPEGA